MKQLYWDNFANEVVTEIDAIAPPERYIWVHCGSTIFNEKWLIDKNKYLDIAYTLTERENGLVPIIRRNIEERYKAHLIYMTDWTVPTTHYKKMEDSMKGGAE